MKSLLENYLYLLTEDKEYDRLEKIFKKAKIEAGKYGSGPEGGDALGNKYRDIPEMQIPKNHREIMQKYKEAVIELNYAKNDLDSHSRFLKYGERPYRPHMERPGAKQGTWGRPKNSFDFNFKYQPNKKLHNKIDIIFWSIVAAWVISVAFINYKKDKKRIYDKSKRLKGKNKEIFIIKSKIINLKKRILVLQKGLIECNNTNNKKRCIDAIMLEINRLRVKILKLEKSLPLTKK